MTKIFKLSELDLSKITFSEPNNNIIYTSLDNKDPVLFETPELYCVDKINKNRTKYSTHELLVTLFSKNRNDTEMCKDFFELLDNKLINIGKNNINNWPFNSKNVTYKSIIRFYDMNQTNNILTQEEIKNNEYYKNGIIKVKFIKSKKFNTLVFGKNKNIIKPDDYENILSGNMYIKMILELVSVWIRDDVYGIYLKLHQVKIINNENLHIPQLYSFNDSSDDECNFICDTEIDNEEDVYENDDDNDYETKSVEINSIMFQNNGNKYMDILEYMLSSSESS